MSNSLAVISSDKRNEKLRAERERKMYFAKQKLLGLALVGSSVWMMNSGMLYDAVTGTCDATFALITIPLGIMLMFSRKKIML